MYFLNVMTDIIFYYLGVSTFKLEVDVLLIRISRLYLVYSVDVLL